MSSSKAIEMTSRATILGLGVAVPGHTWKQKSFPEYYFDITDSNHMVDLKAKFKTLCEKSMIDQRHVHVSDEFLLSNPCITAYKSSSLNLRQELANATVPQLGAEAALECIADWGRPARDITHVVFCSSVSCRMPGANFELVKLLGLPPSTRRFMMYHTGCHGSGIALRLAKDITENNPGARVLLVCSEVVTMVLRGPSETHVENLVGQALFGDAASAAIVGAGAITGEEHPLFEIVSAWQDIVPGTDEAVIAELREEGIVFSLHRDVAMHISTNIERLAVRAMETAGGGDDKDWNKDMFWVVHPGGREILDKVESMLGLSKEKLQASREVMRTHGNTLGSCVLVVLEEMRKTSEKLSLPTAGEGLEWGLLFTFGPGLTVETLLLRALPTNQ